MGLDKRGVNRGACKECDCDEYEPPPDMKNLKCEYCAHAPAQHVAARK